MPGCSHQISQSENAGALLGGPVSWPKMSGRNLGNPPNVSVVIGLSCYPNEKFRISVIRSILEKFLERLSLAE